MLLVEISMIGALCVVFFVDALKGNLEIGQVLGDFFDVIRQGFDFFHGSPLWVGFVEKSGDIFRGLRRTGEGEIFGDDISLFKGLVECFAVVEVSGGFQPIAELIAYHRGKSPFAG